ncbi:MAG TPA: patatin-like phospholipase family protein [Azospirillaceae bacterium]|nr:patatin-like phospholipase family protein [Azospirillaceae bacterium]
MPDINTPPEPSPSAPDIVLVLGGGNALGAYLAGACEQLYEHGIEPRRIVGVSMGAVTGAILAGNPPGTRLDRLRAFWAEAAQADPPLGRSDSGWARKMRNAAHLALASTFGRPPIFRPRVPGVWAQLPWMAEDIAVFDLGPLTEALGRFVDFELLNRGPVRLSVGTLDLETGDEVFFDTHTAPIRAEHILASAAQLSVFPPVEINGRLLGDPAYTNNLPIDRALANPPRRDTVCFAVDPFSLDGARPRTLDQALGRAHELMFAGAARRNIEALRREYALHEKLEPGGASVTLVHLGYRPPAHELAARMFEFSERSIRDRWDAGRRDMADALARLHRHTPTGRFTYLPAVERTTPEGTAGDGAGDGAGGGAARGQGEPAARPTMAVGVWPLPAGDI